MISSILDIFRSPVPLWTCYAAGAAFAMVALVFQLEIIALRRKLRWVDGVCVTALEALDSIKSSVKQSTLLEEDLEEEINTAIGKVDHVVRKNPVARRPSKSHTPS